MLVLGRGISNLGTSISILLFNYEKSEFIYSVHISNRLIQNSPEPGLEGNNLNVIIKQANIKF